MTVKLLAVYNTPEDPAKFDAHYEAVHLPLAQAIPHLQSISVDRVSNVMFGKHDIYMIATMTFADKAAFSAAMASPENRAAGADVMNLTGGRVSLMVVED